jgi:hypothetical protein
MMKLLTHFNSNPNLAKLFVLIECSLFEVVGGYAHRPFHRTSVAGCAGSVANYDNTHVPIAESQNVAGDAGYCQTCCIH